MLTHTNALIVSLDTLTLERNEMEDCVLQAKGEHLWARVAIDNDARSLLLLTDCHTWQTRRIVLPFPASDVTDMVIGANITIATRTGMLLSVAPGTGDIEEIAVIPGSWVRLTRTAERLIALGYNEAHRTVLMGLTTAGHKEGPYTQNDSYLADMIVEDERLYLYNSAFRDFALAWLRFSGVALLFAVQTEIRVTSTLVPELPIADHCWIESTAYLVQQGF